MDPLKRATIVQISDLHMNRKVKSALTDMVCRIINKLSPDILIISGDLANQPVPWQMKKAARFVETLANSCGLQKVIVLPGNHDFKFWGNVGLRRFTRIPFEIYFRRNGFDRGTWWRIGEYFKLAFQSLWFKSTAMREEVIEYVSSKMGVALFAINSNTLTEMMAAGKVEAHDLQDLYAKFEACKKNLKSANEDLDFYYTIGVVHHHPAPIADAPSDAISRIQDSFMIFYNAGLFVRELSRRGFNLLLHGHKHVAGFLRVGCEFQDLGRTVLPVGAAGSATHPAPDDTRGNQLHVIEIFDDDTATLQSWFFAADVERKDASYRYDLDTLQDVRRRRCAIFRNTHKYSAVEHKKTVTITGDGYSRIQLDYFNCRVPEIHSLDHISISLTTGRPSYVRGVKKAPGMPFVKIKPRKEDLYEYKAALNLEPPYTAQTGPFDFGYGYRLMNGHVLTAEEFVRHYSGTDTDAEYASITCEDDCEFLTLDVQFPNNYNLDLLEFDAVAEYVPAPIRTTEDSRLDLGQTEIHNKETDRIRGNIRLSTKGRVLTCPLPIPGMIYKLRWKFREAAEEMTEELVLASAVATAKEKLLKMASDPQAAPTDLQRAQSILAILANDMNTAVGGPREDFEISIMVFDENAQRLKFICSNSPGPGMGDLWAGEGCAGFAFEKARTILYHPKRDPLGYFIHQKEWIGNGQMLEPVVLACFPWIYMSSGSRGLVVGVVNLNSFNKNTKLLNLFGKPPNLPVIMQNLSSLANLAACRFFTL